jgi:hypothetical protein
MKKLINTLLISTTIIISISASCKREPFFPDFDHAGGYVIGKEYCKANADEDYWLVDLSFPLNTVTNYGDTITINGTLYKNMIKTKQLPLTFKEIGKNVSFNFHLSADKVETTGCTVSNAITFKLKNMNVLASFEIR